MHGLRRVLPNSKALAAAAADLFALTAERASAARGRFTVAFSGGSTPKSLFERLASPELSKRVDWAHTQIFWSDERCVPPDHADSNYRMAKEALLSKISIRDSNVHRIHGEAEDREGEAWAYERTLRRFCGAGCGPGADATEDISHNDSDWPVLDLVLLGMGSDGHTASLFPGTDALYETERAVVPVFAPSKGNWRITLTLPTIDSARRVVVLAAGAEKRDMLARVIADPRAAGDGALPICRVSPDDLLWLVDRESMGEENRAGG